MTVKAISNLRLRLFLHSLLVFGLMVAPSIVAAAGSAKIEMQISHFISHLLVLKGGDLFATSDQDGTVKIWSGTSRPGAMLLRTIPSGGRIWAMAASEDGARIATAHNDVIRVWDVETGALVNALEDKQNPLKQVRSIAFANEDRWLLSAGEDTTLRSWNVATGKMELLYNRGGKPLVSLAVSSDGSIVGASDDAGLLRIWNVATRKMIQTIKGPAEPLYGIAISPNNKIIAAGGGVAHVKQNKDTDVRMWNISNGALIIKLPNTIPKDDRDSSNIDALDFSPDGKMLLIGDEPTSIWLVEQKTFRRFPAFDGHGAFIPGTEDIALIKSDEIIRLSVKDGQRVKQLQGDAAAAVNVAVSPDSQRILSWTSEALSIWKLETGERLAYRDLGHDYTQGAGIHAAFTPDGNRIILHFTKGELQALNSDDLKTIWSNVYLEDRNSITPKEGIFFDKDNKKIVLIDQDDTARIFEIDNGTLLRTIGDKDRHTMALGVSANRRAVIRVITATHSDNTKVTADIEVIDIDSGEVSSKKTIKSAGDFWQIWVAPYTDKIITGESLGEDKAVGNIWSTQGEIISVLSSTDWDINAVQFSTTSAHMAASRFEQLPEEGLYPIEIFDLQTGKVVQTFQGHNGGMIKATFSADGTRVVSTARDGIKIWSRVTGNLLATLYDGGAKGWVTATPRGFFAAKGHFDGLISVVKGFKSYDIMHFYERLYRPDLVTESLGDDRTNKYFREAEDLNIDRIVNSGPAPTLKLLDDQTERLGSALRVKVRIKNEGGGIGDRVIWRVNGQARGETNAPKLEDGGPNAIVVEQVLKLTPGIAHRVEVVAYTTNGLLASLPLSFSANVYETAIRETRMHVLAIGITEYDKQDWRLNLAAGDARAFAAAMEEVGKGLFTRVKTTILVDKAATTDGIEKAFSTLAKDPDVQSNDVFVLYIAGHGRYDKGRYYFVPQELNTDPPPNGKNHIIPLHAINQDQLQRWIAAIQVDKRLVILDTCESAQGSGSVIRSFDNPRVTAMEQLQYATGDNLIAAAGQAAFESNKLGHGLLTYAVLESFTSTQRTDTPEKVTTDMVATHAVERVPILSRQIFGEEQRPVRKLSQGIAIPLGYRRYQLKAPDVPPPVRQNFILTENALVRTSPDEAAISDPPLNLRAPMIVNILAFSDDGTWARIQWGNAVRGQGMGVGWVPSNTVQEPNEAPQ